jgi:hypothetical protein
VTLLNTGIQHTIELEIIDIDFWKPLAFILTYLVSQHCVTIRVVMGILFAKKTKQAALLRLLLDKSIVHVGIKQLVGHVDTIGITLKGLGNISYGAFHFGIS